MKRFAFAVCFAARIFLFAEEPVPEMPVSAPADNGSAPAPLVSLPSGVYASAAPVSFFCPEGCRLSGSFDGNPAADFSAPFYLTAEEGTERTYRARVEVRTLAPDSPVLYTAEFCWRIDRKPPRAPSFSAVPDGTGGSFLSAVSDPDAEIRYRMYHPQSGGESSGSMVPGGRVFVPAGAVLCAFAEDGAGNRSAAVCPDPGIFMQQGEPFRIVSPAPGNWANRQAVVLEAGPGFRIYCSFDGQASRSSPEYTEPFLPDRDGILTLDVLAVSPDGQQEFRRQVVYSVTPSALPDLDGVALDGAPAVVPLGSFREITVPDGLHYSFGDPVPALPGGKTVLFSAPSGIPVLYPFSVSDGRSVWRWVFRSGEALSGRRPLSAGIQPDAGNLPDTVQDAAGGTDAASFSGFRILNWHFISFSSGREIYFSFDQTNWQKYCGPVLAARRNPETLYWYSPDWQDSAIQRVDLPAKPGLSGLPENHLSAGSVFLSADNADFVYRYTCGPGFSPETPGPSDPVLDGGLLFEVPAGAEARFFLRIAAFYRGVYQGELPASFCIDRKAPAPPVFRFSDAETGQALPGGTENFFFRPVALHVLSGEENRCRVKIEPPLYTVPENGGHVLSGRADTPVVYTVTAAALDAAGNESAVSSRTVTVDLNAVYAGGSREGEPAAGSPEHPFPTLDAALDFILGREPCGGGSWRLVLQDDVTLSKTFVLQSDLTLSGGGHTVVFSGDAKCILTGASFLFRDCVFRFSDTRTGDSLSGQRAGPFSLFEINRASAAFTQTEMNMAADFDAVLIRAEDSYLTCTDSSFSLSAGEYALLFDVRKSGFVFSGCGVSVQAEMAVGLWCADSEVSLSSSVIHVQPGMTGRGVELHASPFTAEDLSVVRTGGNASAVFSGRDDTAVWFDPADGFSPDLDSVRVSGFGFLAPGRRAAEADSP